MKDKLAINDSYSRYLVYISWFIAEDGDFGATVGDSVPSGNDPESREMRAVYDAIKPLAEGKDSFGFYWDSTSKARAALAVANAALKAHRANRPLEEWEKKAIAAGWKAPKGWRT